MSQQTGYGGTPVIEVLGTNVTGDGLVLGTGAGYSTILGLDLVGFSSGAGLHIETDNNTVENMKLGVALGGTQVPGNSIGILIDGAASNTIGGSSGGSNVIGNNIVAGISISGTTATLNMISGNYIGTNSSGTNLGNAVGVAVIDGTGNLIGGITSASANSIGFNGTAGIQLLGAANDNVVEGNLIGTDAGGDNQANGIGIQLYTANDIIGGTTTGAGNTVAFSATAGIQLNGSGATGDMIQGNWIGTKSASPYPALGNAIGVQVVGGSDNSIGGTVIGAANTIGFNTQNGVSILSGNQNQIRGNLYLGNNTAQSGPASDIQLGLGANDGQPAPTLVAAAVSGTDLDLRISFSTSTPPDVLDVYQDEISQDETGSTQRVFLESATVMQDSTMPNQGEISLTNVSGITPGSLLVATATLASNTSIFSLPVTVQNFYTVTTTEDHGTGSLRQVIMNANTAATLGGVDIKFAIPGSGPFNIAPTTPLPTIAVQVTINGMTEGPPNYSGAPLIEIQGSSSLTDGLVLGSTGSTKSAGSTIKGLDLYDFSAGAGIYIETDNNVVESTYLGTNATGAATGLGNKYGLIIDGAQKNTIGGTSSSMLNLISGNMSDGILIENGSQLNTIESSFIGTDITGKVPLPNGTDMSGLPNDDGVLIDGSANNTLGAPYTGTSDATLLLISGNAQNGIEIDDGSTGNVIENAFIGTDVTGTKALANSGDGILISGASGNTVGAPSAATSNTTLTVISGNTQNGIEIDPEVIHNVIHNASDNQIENSYIGVTFFNAFAPSQNNGNKLDGVYIYDSSNNTVGAAASDALNVISGNGHNGVEIYGSTSTGDAVVNSYIGTDTTGTFSNKSLQNGIYGVLIDGNATQDTIGAISSQGSGSPPVPTDYAGNVISGNSLGGVVIESGSNLLVANTIGAGVLPTGASVAPAIPNGGDGVLVSSTANNTLGANDIGSSISASVSGTSSTSSGGNLIAGNMAYGLAISDDTAANLIAANTIGGTTANAAFNLLAGILLSDSANNTIGGCPLTSTEGNVTGLGSSANLIRGNGGQGILIDYSSASSRGGNNTIEGNQIAANSLDGVLITGQLPTGTGNDQILGNFIGTNFFGTATFNAETGLALGNGLNGVDLQGIAANIQGNLISGNGLNGVNVGQPTNSTSLPAFSDLTGTTITGNKIGTNLSGESVVAIGPLSNAAIPMGNVLDGVFLDRVVGVQVGQESVKSPNIGTVSIGGTAITGANLISGNLGRGIEIQGEQESIPAQLNTILYNIIGTDITGSKAFSPASNVTSGSYNLGNLSDGVFLDNAPDTSIEFNLISNNRGAGIHAVEGSITAPAGSLMIAQNLIGTDGSGTKAEDAKKNALGNSSEGVFLDTVLGASVIQNVISGNRSDGIDLLQSQGVLVADDAIGTGLTGTEAGLGNASSGVVLDQSSKNSIGGPSQDTLTGGYVKFQQNIISGNDASGIFISGVSGTDASGNKVVGNYIGLDSSGNTALANSVSGIVISVADNNIIGGTGSGAMNVISGNQLNGIQVANSSTGNVIQGNEIGTNDGGNSAVGNTAEGILLINVPKNMVIGNTISGNSADGVRIFGGSATGNQIQGNWIGLDHSGESRPSQPGQRRAPG